MYLLQMTTGRRYVTLIGLKDDMEFTPQNHAAVKGQNPWLRPHSDVVPVPGHGARVLKRTLFRHIVHKQLGKGVNY